jgi:valyl-tRNA synthetase
MEVVRAVRNLRAEMKVDLKREVRVLLSSPPELRSLLASQGALMKSLARMDAESLDAGASAPKGAAVQLAGKVQVFLPLEGLLDKGAERLRLDKEQGKLQGLLAAQKAKLSNEAFTAKAPPAVVALERAKVTELESSLAKLKKSLEDLGA